VGIKRARARHENTAATTGADAAPAMQQPSEAAHTCPVNMGVWLPKPALNSRSVSRSTQMTCREGGRERKREKQQMRWQVSQPAEHGVLMN
jgi:hypothetical protein